MEKSTGHTSAIAHPGDDHHHFVDTVAISAEDAAATERLHELGYAQQMPRRLGLIPAIGKLLPSLSIFIN